MGTAPTLRVWLSGLILRDQDRNCGADTAAVLYCARVDDRCGGAMAGLAFLVAAV